MRQCSFVMLLCLLLAGGWATAQDIGPIENPVIGFVEDRTLRTASITDDGEDGLTRLGVIFRQYGAQTRLIRLDEAIPPEVDLVVLVRPTRPLQPAQVGRLWDFLADGGHLLLALDPNGPAAVNSERATGGLNRLLLAEYGLGTNDDALIEGWFGRDQFRSPATMWTTSQPEAMMQHPVVAPLVRYDVPVYVWAARSVQVSPYVADAEAYPLIFTDTPFGETNANSFRTQEPDPVELNIGTDRQGRLLIGGIGENAISGSRVALLGDSEMLENIFGLTNLSSEDSGPRYPGNQVLADRLTGWLLGVPEEDWPDLPGGFTWIALDGDASDWDASLRTVSDDILDSPRNDIKQARAFYNDQYLYLLIETASETDAALRITLNMDDAGVARQVQIVNGQAEVVVAEGENTLLPDAAVAVGQAIEVRLPRRAFTSLASITQICLEQASMGNEDCLDATFRPPLVTDLDPVPVRPANGPIAFLRNSGNLRAEPSTTATVLTSLSGRTPVGVLGRNEAGDWIKVHDGRWEGWLALPLLVLSADVELLPVLP